MKEMKGFEEFVFENSKSTLIEEGLMAQIDQLIKDTKDIEEFVKKFFKEYGSKIKKDKKSEEWVRSLYSGSTNESMQESEDVTLKYVDFLNEEIFNIDAELKQYFEDNPYTPNSSVTHYRTAAKHVQQKAEETGKKLTSAEKAKITKKAYAYQDKEDSSRYSQQKAKEEREDEKRKKNNLLPLVINDKAGVPDSKYYEEKNTYYQTRKGRSPLMYHYDPKSGYVTFQLKDKWKNTKFDQDILDKYWAIVEAKGVTLKYADFLNEGTLNEAMDVSDDLKKVKTLEDFLSVTKGKYIVIQSKHDILNIRKRGGQWPAVWIAWDTSKKVVPHLTITDRASALSVNYIANESSGRYGVSPERLFEFFMFNKKRGNKIYTESKMPMQNEIKPLYDKIVGGMSEISNKILTYEVDLGNRKIGNGHVLRKEGQSHGDRIYEYTVNKMGKTAIYNVYYNTTKISEGRNTFRTGYGDNDVFKVGAKDQRRIGDIFETNSNLMDKCLGIINKWIKGQAIKVK